MATKRLGVGLLLVVLLANVVKFNFTTYDNGMPQQLWATDNFRSKVTIETLGGDAYKLTRNDDGSSFETLSAKSPGGDGSTFVAAGVKGKISGGLVVIIHGTPKNPMPTNVSRDFRGDTTPNKYFLPFFDSITSVEYVSWGWKYTTCGNGFWLDNEQTETLYSQVGPNPTMGDIQGTPAACQNEEHEPAKWFDPGDGRVDPRPGDRLAVWCNADSNPANVVVYGVAGSDQPDWNKGFYLATFVNADLIKAGPGGLTKPTPAGGFLSIMQDGAGHFYVAWNGGSYNATGQGDWSKSFTCNFPASKQ